MIMLAITEDSIDICAGTHREEVVQPDTERKDADRHGRDDHRAIAEEWLA
jgi:hypothetical protein